MRHNLFPIMLAGLLVAGCGTAPHMDTEQHQLSVSETDSHVHDSTGTLRA